MPLSVEVVGFQTLGVPWGDLTSVLHLLWGCTPILQAGLPSSPQAPLVSPGYPGTEGLFLGQAPTKARIFIVRWQWSSQVGQALKPPRPRPTGWMLRQAWGGLREQRM